MGYGSNHQQSVKDSGFDENSTANGMDIEKIGSQLPKYEDKIQEKLSNSSIILSNFGELPTFSFKN